MFDSYIAISTRRALRFEVSFLDFTPYIDYASSERSGETASLRRIVRVYVNRPKPLSSHWIINVAFVFILWHVKIYHRKYTHHNLFMPSYQLDESICNLRVVGCFDCCSFNFFLILCNQKIEDPDQTPVCMYIVQTQIRRLWRLIWVCTM